MRTRKNNVAMIMAVLMVFAMMPMTTGVAFASTSGGPVVGLTGVLGTGANTVKAQTVYYGTNGGTPVAWRVIKYKNTGNAYIEDQTNTTTLFASDCLASSVQFNPETNYNNDYKGSNLKSVVDGLYGSLFSTKEKSAIQSRELYVDEYASGHNSTGVSGTETSGYLWPLSTAEAFNLPSDEFRRVGERWWLRSPGERDDYAANVYISGYVNRGGAIVSYNNNDSVRPAFNLDLSSVLFTSAAEGGKPSGTVGADALQQISTNTTGEWKLTVHDSNLDTFQAIAATGAVLSAEAGYTSWSIPIAYSLQSDDPTYMLPEPNAQNHVAAILADSSDNALYYGVIDINNYGGTKNINIPIGLPAGAYKLHVFIEMTKGDKLTDYASAFRTIDLTVTKPAYTLTVNNGEGSGEYAKGAEVTIKADAPAPGKQFKEWTVEGVDELSFKTGSSATTAKATFTMPAHAVTVTATYEDKPRHHVDVGNGTGGGDYYEGADVTITAVAPATGWRFKEWTGDVDRVTFTEGDATTSIAKFSMPDEPLFFKATYEAIPAATYAVTVNNGDGDGEYEKDAEVTITADAPATGKQFKEWTGDVDLVTFTEGSKTTSTAKFKMPAKSLTFEATYEDIPVPPVETFMVTFDDGQGNTLKKETVEKGQAATAPTAPAREGYTFNGWDEDFSNVTADLKVTAQWKKNTSPSVETFMVTFDDGQGNTLKKETVEKGKAATAPTVPTRDGYTFNGWDKDFSNVTADMKVTAQWKANAIPEPESKDDEKEVAEARKSLEDVVAKDKKIEPGNYTEDSYKALKDAILEAEDLAEDPNATAEQLKAATAKIEAAKNSLKEKDAEPTDVEKAAVAAKQTLNDAVTDAKSIKQGSYTDESYKELQDAINAAESLAADPNATAEQLKAAAERIEEAKNALALKTDPTEEYGNDGTAVGPGASAEAADKAIKNLKSDNDPEGAKFAPLKLKSTKQTSTSIKLTWKKVKGAKKYVIYANKCGKKNKPKRLAKVTGSSRTVKKVAGKKLKKGTYYKFIVVALDSNNKVVSTSRIIHVATKGKGNPTKVTVSKKVKNNKVTIKKGKTFKLAGKAVGKNVNKHVGIRYESSNKKVATVTKSGKIKGKKKGTCKIYVFAQNGLCKTIKVTVK